VKKWRLCGHVAVNLKKTIFFLKNVNFKSKVKTGVFDIELCFFIGLGEKKWLHPVS
jgi:hypothetical protein